MHNLAIMPKFLALRNIPHKGGLTVLFHSHIPHSAPAWLDPRVLFSSTRVSIRSTCFLSFIIPNIQVPKFRFNPNSKAMLRKI